MKKISADTLKIIAIIAMLIDHIAFLFIDNTSTLYISMRFIGRLTFPIIAFFIVEGFYRTKNLKKYIFRLTILAIVSAFAFYFFTGKIYPTSSILTLLSGLLLLTLLKSKIDISFKITLAFILLIIGSFGDYSFWGILLIVLLGVFHTSYKKQVLIFILMFIIRFIFLPSIYAFGFLLVIPLLYFYNSDIKPNKKISYFFYIFYPLHLIILKILSLI